MRDAGFEVEQCGGPGELAGAMRSRPADLIALASEGEGGGLEAIRLVRQNPHTRSIPVLLLSDSLRVETVEPALEAGADDWIDGGFSAEELQVRVRLIIRSRKRACIAPADRALCKRLDAMALLHGFYEQVLANDGVEATCRQSAETAARLVNSERVSVLLTDARTHRLRLSHTVGIDPGAWQDRQIPLSTAVAGRVLATGHELVVNSDTPWPRQTRYRNAQFISMPLLRTSRDRVPEVLGILNVTERCSGQDFEPQDVLALRQLARAAAFAIDAARTRHKLDETRDSIIFSLAKLSEYRHASTGKHLERVRELSLVLARELARDPRVNERIDGQFLTDLGRAAPLHDVGKVGIPDRILLKEGRLTAEEFAVMRNHTAIGAATLESVMAAGHDDSFLKMAMDIAHCHHERFDGAGYPRGLAAESIPLSARVVCLADSYDAIRMPREYKAARTHAEASRELLVGSGSQFDPVVVQAFCAVENQFERIYNNLMEDSRLARDIPGRSISRAAVP